MPETDLALTPPRRSILRLLFPAAVVVVMILAIGYYQVWPVEDWEPAKRVVGSMMSLQLGLLALGIWLIGFSGYRWRVRLAILLVPVVVAVAAVRKVKFTGDMVPIFQFRWSPTADEVL